MAKRGGEGKRGKNVECSKWIRSRTLGSGVKTDEQVHVIKDRALGSGPKHRTLHTGVLRTEPSMQGFKSRSTTWAKFVRRSGQMKSRMVRQRYSDDSKRRKRRKEREGGSQEGKGTQKETREKALSQRRTVTSWEPAQAALSPQVIIKVYMEFC